MSFQSCLLEDPHMRFLLPDQPRISASLYDECSLHHDLRGGSLATDTRASSSREGVVGCMPGLSFAPRTTGGTTAKQGLGYYTAQKFLK
jgi:hypothetical protein